MIKVSGGGWGVGWRARDDELGRDTALKFLPEVVANDRASVEDLKREVRRAMDLAHPHIVKIHDFVTDGHTAAVSMEYVAGDTLSSLRVDEPGQVFTPEKLAPWVEQLCGALDYAHRSARVVHRDLKPANLMVNQRGELKVLDFGIAASLSESVTRVSAQAGSSGTPVYMSPQQMMGEDPAVTDDVYALGATLYELLTGKPPFYSGNVFMQVQHKVPPT
ncbi:MAG: serine/threonine protein kinase, partial [Bdellovibrionaceae bacterium]|nr:serine/threonine protein kinase [Pseudobdellovibrionaceae bacterium]